MIGRLRALAPEAYAVAQPPAWARRRQLAQTWEQTALPAAAARRRAALIFSPANLAPLAWPRNVLVMHDAAVLREPDAYSPAYRAWHRRFGLACARRAVGVVTVSEFSRAELIELAGLDPERLTVIAGGVGAAFRPRAADPATADAAEAADGAVARRWGLERPYVLTIATTDARKNLTALERSARELAALGIDLAWAGDARPYFSRAPPPAGLRRLGYVPDADLPALYRGALAFVLPSRYEGFGLTCVEAMACGTPVVAADRGALPETCDGAALLVDPDDHAALAAAVVAAATDESLRDRLRAGGLRRAAALTWDATAARTHGLLTRLADAA